MDKYITDERSGLKYELFGDYYFIASDDEPDERLIGIWGQRHLRYLKQHRQTVYTELLTSGKLNGYLGGLYNNMALTLTELTNSREAEDLFHKAIEVMEKQKNGELEVAITRLNIADLIAACDGFENGEKEIENQLLEAQKLLYTDSLPRDGYYAFVCEKCAPVFGYHRSCNRIWRRAPLPCAAAHIHHRLESCTRYAWSGYNRLLLLWCSTPERY